MPIWNALKLTLLFQLASLLVANRTLAETFNKVAQINQSPSDSSTRSQLQQIDHYSQTLTIPSVQVTSVSQLSDVQPTDWASLALQSLAKRYGCIVGYSDTYRGNRAITRNQFATELNACLQQVNRLITADTSNLVRKEDLAILQRLQGEFAAELTTLRSRVNNLEVRTAEQEANQFSPTTTISGEVLFSVTGGGY